MRTFFISSAILLATFSGIAQAQIVYPEVRDSMSAGVNSPATGAAPDYVAPPNMRPMPIQITTPCAADVGNPKCGIRPAPAPVSCTLQPAGANTAAVFGVMSATGCVPVRRPVMTSNPPALPASGSVVKTYSGRPVGVERPPTFDKPTAIPAGTRTQIVTPQ